MGRAPPSRGLGGRTGGTKERRARRRARRGASGGRPAKHRDGRGARRSRREEEEYWAYSTDEQRRAAGCIGRRMPRAFHRGLLTNNPGLQLLLLRQPGADALRFVGG